MEVLGEYGNGSRPRKDADGGQSRGRQFPSAKNDFGWKSAARFYLLNHGFGGFRPLAAKACDHQANIVEGNLFR